jgi:hypothetical protein
MDRRHAITALGAMSAAPLAPRVNAGQRRAVNRPSICTPMRHRIRSWKFKRRNGDLPPGHGACTAFD